MPFADDILIEVLKRLPMDKLFDFKCVCKRWNNIISGNYFRLIYEFESRLQENLLLTPLGFYRSLGEIAFFPTVSQNLTEKAAPYFRADGFSFVDSCNGLLLFHSSLKRIYLLCNPVTKEWRVIYEPYHKALRVAVAFYCPSQKLSSRNLGHCSLVFLVAFKYDNLCAVYRPSPSCTLWNVKYFNATADINFKNSECAVAVKGYYYWLSLSNSILACTMSCSRNTDNSTVKVIPLPMRKDKRISVSSVLSESIDGLLQYMRSDSYKIVVWVLKKDSYDLRNSEWVFRYDIHYEQMRDKFPKIDQFCTVEDVANIRYAKLVACHPSDPAIILVLLNEIIVSYCVHNKRVVSVQRIQNRDKKSGDRPPWEWRGRIVPYFSPVWAASFLFPRSPMVVNAKRSYITSNETHLGANPWLDALLRQALSK